MRRTVGPYWWDSQVVLARAWMRPGVLRFRVVIHCDEARQALYIRYFFLPATTTRRLNSLSSEPTALVTNTSHIPEYLQ